MAFNKTLILSVASIATMAFGAQAQDRMPGNAGGGNSPAAQSSPSPNAGGAPSARDIAPGQTKGDASPARDVAPGQIKPEGSSARDEAPGMKKQGKAERSEDGADRKQARDDAKAKDRREDKSAKDDAKDSKAEKRSFADDKENAGEDAGNDQTRAQRRDDSRDKAEPGDATGPKGSVAQISPEQKREVKSAFSKHHAKAETNIDISVGIGVVVPRSVKFYPVPEDIIVIAPAYRDYLYFVVDDRVCIVDPVSYEIVDIIVIA